LFGESMDLCLKPIGFDGTYNTMGTIHQNTIFN